jgi:hypothetical protein
VESATVFAASFERLGEVGTLELLRAHLELRERPRRVPRSLLKPYFEALNALGVATSKTEVRWAVLWICRLSQSEASLPKLFCP